MIPPFAAIPDFFVRISAFCIVHQDQLYSCVTMAKIFDVLMTSHSQLKGDAAVRHGRIVLNLLLDLVVSKVNNAGTYNADSV